MSYYARFPGLFTGAPYVPDPWNISTAVYASKSVSTNAQGGNAGLTFSSDGTKMYFVVGNTTVYQFALSSAWNVSTATSSTSYNSSAQTTNCGNLFFKDDGTSMFIWDNNNAVVYQYTLSTPWDVSTASYASKSFNASTQTSTGSCSGMYMSSDGTKMYLLEGSNNIAYQYTLSTPWDVSTASYASKSFNFDTQLGGNYGTTLPFKTDGTAVYVMDNTNCNVYQYTLSTPWDISTTSYSGISKTPIGSPAFLSGSGGWFKPDGLAFYCGSRTFPSTQWGVAQYNVG